MISTTEDRTSDHRMQSRNSNTDLLIHIGNKRCPINSICSSGTAGEKVKKRKHRQILGSCQIPETDLELKGDSNRSESFRNENRNLRKD